MKNCYWIISCIFLLYSCKQDYRNDNSLKSNDLEVIKDSTWLEFEHINKESDSLKITLYHYLDKNNVRSYLIEDQYSVFYFTFDDISDEKLKQISFMEEDEFDQARNKYNISTIHFDSSQTKRSFYMELSRNKKHRLFGLIQDNFYLKPKDTINDEDQVRKIGTIIREVIDFSKID